MSRTPIVCVFALAALIGCSEQPPPAKPEVATPVGVLERAMRQLCEGNPDGLIAMLPPGALVASVQETLESATKAQKECEAKGGFESLEVVDLKQTELVAVVTARAVHRDGSRDSPDTFSFTKTAQGWVLAK